MKWEKPKPHTPSAAYHITCGRWTICKARVGDEWRYTLSEGRELVVTGTVDECKAEALRRNQEAA